MSEWVAVDDHVVQVLADGGVLWEHDARQPYAVPRHMVSPVTGARWTVQDAPELTLTPSLFCDPGRGGCGRHGIVTHGHWAGD
jgi:hypothetical protein